MMIVYMVRIFMMIVYMIYMSVNRPEDAVTD